MIDLDIGQVEAINKLQVGNILSGKVGSGKTRTSLAYYYTKILDGSVQYRLNDGDEFISIESEDRYPAYEIPLYVITTAKKRDSFDWEREAIDFCIQDITVDSWNNIGKYKDVKNAFFIFDEQRLVSSDGKWSTIFLKITQHNQWILLSATPGDKWEDYFTIFKANHFYRTLTEFKREHLVYQPYVTYPHVIGYMGERKLKYYRDKILVDIPVKHITRRHEENLEATYDKDLYSYVGMRRKHPVTGERLSTAATLCNALRYVVNSDPSRAAQVKHVVRHHEKLIIFYNFNYELDILRGIDYPKGTAVAEWNGHKHEPIPNTTRWVYLVQYTSGCEGWNCTETNAILFYSQTYSYKTLEQSEGRIDRRNTEFDTLYYYHIVSRAPIDLSISRALKNKKRFNASAFAKKIL